MSAWLACSMLQLVDLVVWSFWFCWRSGAVVDGAGQEAADRLDDVIDPGAHRGEGVGGHRPRPPR